MKKSLFLTIIILINVKISFSQWEENSLQVNFSNNEYINDCSFPTADIGYTLAGFLGTGYAPVKVYKTTNKSVNWNHVNDVAPSSIGPPALTFVDINIGFVVTTSGSGANQDIQVYRTSNQGVNWALIYTIDNVPNSGATLVPEVKFINSNTGYLNSGYNVYKTTNAGSAWNEIISRSQVNNGVINSIEVSKLNSNLLYIAGRTGTIFGAPVFLKSENAGATFMVIEDGIGDPNGLRGINDLSLVMDDNTEYLKFASNNGIGEFLTVSNTLSIIAQPVDPDDYIYQKIIFTDRDHGVVYLESRGASTPNYIYGSADGGISWNEEFGTGGGYYRIRDVDKIGDVVNATYYKPSAPSSQPEVFMLTRRININLTAKRDFQNIFVGNTSIDINNENYILPYNGLSIRGGTYLTQINQSIAFNDKIFYKWDDNDLRHTNPNQYFDTGRDITAHYKSKQYSTTGAAISERGTTRALRDKSGIVHQVHESMGGIFYTSSTDNGATFKQEEVVNYEPDKTGDGNYNPAITEIHNPFVSPVDAKKNLSVIWQRREGTNEKIKFVYRTGINNFYSWQRGPEYDFSIPSASSFNAQAKVFVRHYDQNDIHNYFTLIPHLVPNGASADLVVRGKANIGANPITITIESGGVSEFAVANENDGPYNILHFTYKKNNNIYYEKHRFFIFSPTVGSEQIGQTFEVSQFDGLSTRITPDISLRSRLPVIAYRGFKAGVRYVSYESDNQGNELPEQVNLSYYPIVVRYKTTNGGNPWSAFVHYNSNGFNTQQNPNVEGSKDANAHLVNYSVNNSLFKQFVGIDGVGGYYCNPSTFTGTDAKFIRGSYSGQTGSSSYPSLLTLEPENSLYRVGKQSFSITNVNQPISQIDAFDNLSGVIGMDNINYVFNLGPIIAKNTIQFDKELPQQIQNPIDFNNNLVSDVFMLSNNDTLILGAVANYVNQSESAIFHTIRYNVNLVNNSTGLVHRLLFRDSVQTEDSIQSEYLRGFVIDNILNSTDSFYVQVAVDEADLNDGDYTFNGVYQGNENDGIDAPMAFRIKVVFEGDNASVSNSVPSEFALSQNYPNPFNPVTTINYNLPKSSTVKLYVYDITGREIAVLVNEVKPAGSYISVFNASMFSSGVYFYKIEAGDFKQVKRMVLIK